MKNVVLYGAGFIGKEYYEFFYRHNLLDCIYCFCDREGNNIENINGIPVYPYEMLQVKDKEFIISVGSRFHQEIENRLSHDGVEYFDSLYEWLKRRHKVLLNNYRSEIGLNKKVIGIPIPLRFCNKIECSEKWLKKLFITRHIKWEFYHGGDNVISIGHNVRLNNVRIHVYGHSNHIEIKDNCIIYDSILRTDGKDNFILIGENTKICGGYIHALGRTSIKIGENCLFSHEVDIRSGDGHNIYDITSKKIRNKAKDIVIGNHVWIGKRVLCLKGTIIPDNCVVGGGSVVTKGFDEPNSIIAGNPAKVINTNIFWEE